MNLCPKNMESESGCVNLKAGKTEKQIQKESHKLPNNKLLFSPILFIIVVVNKQPISIEINKVDRAI